MKNPPLSAWVYEILHFVQNDSLVLRLSFFDYATLCLALPNSKLNRMTSGVVERIYESPLSFYDIPPLSRGDKN